MANFYAYDFIYDGIPSHTFDLKIITFEDGGLFGGIGSSDVEIYTQKIQRKAKPYYLGRSQQPVLEFPLTFGTAHPISGMDRDIISGWLFGRSGYKKLEILQDDLNGAYFNCFMTKPEPQYIGNVNYAFKCQVICDSPFAYSIPKSISGTFSSYELTTTSYILYNYSTDDDYLYPTISFTLNSVPGHVSVINRTDNNREFLFEDLSVGETITVDNDLQIITSSTGLYRLSNFNKHWFRLLPKTNSLYLEGCLSSFSIAYTEKIKIGG